MSEGHGIIEGSNKKVALLISILALCLAFGETLAKGAQTEALSDNVEATNLWAFYQAKTIRTTVVKTAGEMAALQHAQAPDEGAAVAAAAYAKQSDDWHKTLARFESDPGSNEGRKELTARAKEAEHRHDTALAKYHHYELGSAAFQIGIVLASAMVITGIVALAWAGVGLGIVGVVILGIGLFAPHAVHLI